MIEMKRPAPARILKQRDVPSLVARPAAEPALPVEAAVIAPSPEPRCVTKEARLGVAPSGARVLDVRCSCGEWTRVELQLEVPTENQR
ncbi:MAG: hypothetical protein JNK02_08060 [Planctomycetes bacterium]|nr:hypothetical protein [Planctomycetota bacterium]